jgi:hypothetical protein
MYCDYHEEHVSTSDCYGCNHDCERNQNAEEKAAERGIELERLRSSELATGIRATLTKTLGIALDDDKIDSLIVDLFDGAFRTAERQFEVCLTDLANKMAVEYIEVKAKNMLDASFERALESHILEITKNSKGGESHITKIQEIITKRMIRFFAEKDEYNNRNRTESTIEKAIGSIVNSKVEEALKEITEEAIGKFNKEAMKKMMNGMVGAIQGDKRLLAVLAGE